MLILLKPQRSDDPLAVHKQGDVLTINGETFDFSSLPEGATIPFEHSPSPWVLGPIDRIGGLLQLTLVVPFRFGGRHVDAPPPLHNPPDGLLALPNLDFDHDMEEPSDVDA